MPNTFTAPNLYQVQNEHLHISYSTSGIDGKPHFHYQDAAQSLNFTPDQIHTETTEIGTLVSVRIRASIDAGSTSFTLLVPTVNLPAATPSVPIQTFGITTVHKFSIFPPLNTGQTELYSQEALTGTARHVAF